MSTPENSSSWQRKLFPELSIERLRISQLRLEGQLQQLASQEKAADPWLVETRRLHDEAHKYIKLDNSEAAWCLHKAALCEFMASWDGDQRQRHAKQLAIEACSEDKIKGWRRNALQAMLDCDKSKPDEPGDGITLGQLQSAQRLVDEQQNNEHHKLTILRLRLCWLAMSTVIILTLWSLLAPFPAITASSPLLKECHSACSWLLVIGASLLGAVISGFTSTLSAGIKQRIPVERAQTAIVLGRFALAAASGVASVLLLHSGLLNLGAVNDYGMLGVAVAAGFSERFLLKALLGSN